MKVDCHWIEKNMEAVFCERLSSEQDHLARSHFENCPACREKADDLKAIDPLVKQFFRHELLTARIPRQRRSPLRAATLASAFAAIILVVIWAKPYQVSSPAVNPPPATIAANPDVPQLSPVPKITDGGSPSRAKPEPGATDKPASPQQSAFPPAGIEAPDFLVTDPAGYSRSLSDYHGYVLILGVWNSDQPQTVSNLERIYQTLGSNTKLRILGVPGSRQMKAANVTFPTAYNQNSKLMDAKAGQFAVVDANGTVQLRGSLLQDPAKVLSSIRTTLATLGVN